MPAEQLSTYIRERLSIGIDRAVIVQELITAGWQEPAITEALKTFDNNALAAPPSPTISRDAPVVGALPSATALVRDGLQIYGANYQIFLTAGLIQMLPGVLLIVTIQMLGFMGVTFSSVLIVPIVLLTTIATMLISTWSFVAMMQAIRARNEHIDASEAFRRARPYILSSLWLGALVSLVSLGALAVTILPFALLGLWLIFVHGVSFVASIVLLPLFLVSSVVVMLIFGTWLSFPAWVMLDTNTRGTRLLAESKRLASFEFWAIFRRILVIGLYCVLAVIPFMVANTLIAIFFPIASAEFGLLLQCMSVLVGYPILFGIMFALYEAVKVHVPAAPSSPKGRGLFITLALIGLFGIVVLPVGSVFILASLNSTHATGKDVTRKLNVEMIRLGLEMYAVEKNLYPAHLTEVSVIVPTLSSSSLSDPVTHQPLSYQSDGTSYKLCATLSIGEEYCVRSERLPIDPVDAGFSTTTPVKSSLRFADSPYMNTVYGFRFDTPADWAIQGTGDPSNNQGLTFMRPTQDVAGVRDGKPVYYAAAVTFWVTPPSYDVGSQEELDSYVAAKQAKLKKDLPTFKILSESNESVGSWPSKRFIATWQFDNGSTVTMLQLNTVKNGQVYELAAIASSEKWSEYEPFYTTLVNSFSFL